jgi:mercuric ion transport protein
VGAVLLMLVGLLASFGVAACCALPFLLAMMGVGAAWLGGIALLAAPHRLALMALSAACIAGGATLLWRRRARHACEQGSTCVRPAVHIVTVTGLVLACVFLYLGYLYV